jgi:hypothetical protein
MTGFLAHSDDSVLRSTHRLRDTVPGMTREADLARFAADCVRQHRAGAVSSPINVSLTAHSLRPGATLLRFRVNSPHAGGEVFVKASDESACHGTDRHEDRNSVEDTPPRVFGRARSRMEYTALRAIESHFAGLADSRFGVVRALGLMEEGSAICVEGCPHPTLRAALTRRKSREYRPRLGPAFRNAGAWLKVFHGMEVPDHCVERHVRRDDFLRHVQAQCDFLGRSLGDEEFFSDVTSKVRRLGGRVLPDSLPSGVGHGDYAPRNIMVAQEGTVFVIDTLARWRTCIYEDLSSFIFALSSASVRSLVLHYPPSLGTTRQNQYVRDFLTGYFADETIPYAALHLYHVQAVLNKWAAVVSSPEWPGTVSKHMRPVALSALRAAFRRTIRRTIFLASQAVIRSPPEKGHYTR